MANPVLIMSIAITRNRVLGFKNQPYEGFGCQPTRSNSLTNSSNEVFLKNPKFTTRLISANLNLVNFS